ncbi:hypothetical protein LB503_011259 [Fusarium chuoi]|nr:hypothetical protein LB503_011259 [Fusarium chuoi]
MVSASPGHERDHDGMASPHRKQEAWWRIHLFRGMVSDIRRRIPYYVSDWTDAWDYRVVPATVYMYFANWSLILHWILAVTNSCNWLRWVTRFPCDIFGFYVAFIYLQKGIQVLEHLGRGQEFYLSIVAALLVFMVAYDYGTPLTIIFFTGFVHFGRMQEVDLEVLPTGIAFEPTSGRAWLVRFWDLRVGDIFLALPFAVLLTILFWFDHNVSSLIAQGSEFPLRKPAGFHWDIFLLGLTTGVAGILGLPFPNGLIPQAPFHTESLCVTKAVKEDDEDGNLAGGGYSFEATHVVEQRFSNFAQGLLTLGTMTGPLLVVLHLIPHGVLAGLFFVMGVQALEGNGITSKLVFLARDRALTPSNSPLLQIRRRSAIWYYVLIELVGFGATFAITQTVAAVGFPVIIFALIPIRALLLPYIFSPEELSLLDQPTASDFIMEGIGGSWGGKDDDKSALQQRDALRRPEHRDSVLAHPGAPRRSQADLAELGQIQSGQSTATRRRSLERRQQRKSTP